TGSAVKNPKYVKTIIGTSVDKIIEDNIKEGNVRYISGNVLTGDKIDPTGYLGFYHSQVTVIPEGDEPKLMITKGWMEPGIRNISITRSYVTWRRPNKNYKLDTNLNSEARVFLLNGETEKVSPFDISLIQLIKSVIYTDIALMEPLAISEV